MWRRAVATTATAAAPRYQCRYYAKAPKSSKKSKVQPSEGGGGGGSGAADVDYEAEGLQFRLKQLALDEKDKSLNVGINGAPLFTSAPSLSQLTRADTCSYLRFDMDNLNATLPEGLPDGMLAEFDDSKRCALLVRQSFLDLRDNFRRIVDPPSWSTKAPKVQKQIVLDGPRSCGKSIALAMLAHWARDEGWLVFYSPKGREWTHGELFLKNPQTGLWDTPVHAEKMLKDFLKFNESLLQQLPCQVTGPIPLGEIPEVGYLKGITSTTMPEGSTLFDLVQTGITNNQAAVGVVVRLRQELSLVKDVPVLLAIDQYNSWFTFSKHKEDVTDFSWRPVHARELATVNAFRPMMHDNMMVGAFSHSTAVGKLRRDLPGVPEGARVHFPRYSLEEAGTVCHYYVRQRLIRREVFTEEKWKKMYYLSHGNGKEMRFLSPIMY